MAVSAAQINVPTSAVALTAAETDARSGSSVVVTAGATAVFLGGAGVTTATGYQLSASSSISLDLAPGEQLFAVATVATTVSVLATGV